MHPIYRNAQALCRPKLIFSGHQISKSFTKVCESLVRCCCMFEGRRWPSIATLCPARWKQKAQRCQARMCLKLTPCNGPITWHLLWSTTKYKTKFQTNFLNNAFILLYFHGRTGPSASAAPNQLWILLSKEANPVAAQPHQKPRQQEHWSGTRPHHAGQTQNSSNYYHWAGAAKHPPRSCCWLRQKSSPKAFLLHSSQGGSPPNHQN